MEVPGTSIRLPIEITCQRNFILNFILEFLGDLEYHGTGHGEIAFFVKFSKLVILTLIFLIYKKDCHFA
jgi:hypothetical protein